MARHKSIRFALKAMIAAVFLSLAIAPAIQAAPAKVGVASKVAGDVAASLDNKQRQVLDGGDIYLGDVVATGEASGLEIVFDDGTKIVLGEQTAMAIDEYVYKPKEKEGGFLSHLFLGTVRIITGLAADYNPERFRVVTPNATVGIRGTDFGLDQKASKDGKEKSIYEIAKERGTTVKQVLLDMAWKKDFKDFEKDPQEYIQKREQELKDDWAEYHKEAAKVDEKLRAQGKGPPFRIEDYPEDLQKKYRNLSWRQGLLDAQKAIAEGKTEGDDTAALSGLFHAMSFAEFCGWLRDYYKKEGIEVSDMHFLSMGQLIAYELDRLGMADLPEMGTVGIWVENRWGRVELGPGDKADVAPGQAPVKGVATREEVEEFLERLEKFISKKEDELEEREKEGMVNPQEWLALEYLKDLLKEMRAAANLENRPTRRNPADATRVGVPTQGPSSVCSGCPPCTHVYALLGGIHNVFQGMTLTPVGIEEKGPDYLELKDLDPLNPMVRLQKQMKDEVSFLDEVRLYAVDTVTGETEVLKPRSAVKNDTEDVTHKVLEADGVYTEIRSGIRPELRFRGKPAPGDFWVITFERPPKSKNLVRYYLKATGYHLRNVVTE